MKKALLYSLSLALLLSLAACHKPQTNQQEPSQPEPAATSAPADVSTPEPIKDTPDPEPPVQPVPEPVKDTTPEPELPETPTTEPPADPAPEPEQIPVTPAENKTATPPKKTPPKAQPEPKPVEDEAPQQTVPETPPVSDEPVQPSSEGQQTQQPDSGSSPMFGDDNFDYDAFNEQLKQNTDLAPSGHKWAEVKNDNNSFTEEEIEDIHREFAKQRGYGG